MIKFSEGEVRDILITFAVLSICFAISSVGLDVHGFISILPIIMVGVGMGFILRDLAQKFVAMKYGCEAEFKLWPIGLLIAFVTAFFGIVFAFPGEIRTSDCHITDEINGRIGVAGPMANMTLALIFIVIAALIYPLKAYSHIFNLLYLIDTVGFSVNSFLATFNLLPIYSLDGTKVMKWNVKIWIITFAIAGIMMLVSISIGAENMVKMVIGA